MPVDIQNYVFIDGNYLSHAYEAAMRPFFADADSTNLDLVQLKTAVSASKAFYYDAIDEDQPLDEVQKRKDRLEFIRSLDGFHVREGSVSTRKKRKEQKQVDVRLAVECLTHAFNKNFWHVTLVAGDLDFKPLVDALINLGIHVHVLYERTSGNKLLYKAADVGQVMTREDSWQWSTVDYKKANPIPTYAENQTPTGILKKRGLWNGRTVELFFHDQRKVHTLFALREQGQRQFIVEFQDLGRLEQYFQLRFGPVEWPTVPDSPATF